MGRKTRYYQDVYLVGLIKSNCALSGSIYTGGVPSYPNVGSDTVGDNLY